MKSIELMYENHTQNELRRSKTTLQTSGEDQSAITEAAVQHKNNAQSRQLAYLQYNKVAATLNTLSNDMNVGSEQMNDIVVWKILENDLC